ncbi:imm68 putative immunity domain-containing protein [uncultured Aquimarina sp.]|uniref:imm68 putative immunity domain-containing protein n=1 Tax=uncultured Aquimarina sp. TaxID=575652 RepID=UPI00261B61BA|nr:imm68 putative immunity domain-containing protein [uncultured Aquimarina sp.]
MIENWKDTAFGSDFGGDFLELVENITSDTLTMDLIYTHSDVKKYIDNPDLLHERTDNNVRFTNSKFEQYIHFEDLIIALSAIIVEAGIHGQVDLTKAYGNKVLKFQMNKEEITPVYEALQTIYNTPDSYVMFEMCMKEEREETLKDIKDILSRFEKLVN